MVIENIIMKNFQFMNMTNKAFDTNYRNIFVDLLKIVVYQITLIRGPQ